MYDLIRQKHGADIDPLAGVAPEHLEEARRTVMLWQDARRSELRQLARAMRKDSPPEWKKSVLAKVCPRRAVETEGRYRRAALLALAAVAPDFDALVTAL